MGFLNNYIIAPGLIQVDEDRVIEYSADALRCASSIKFSQNWQETASTKENLQAFISIAEITYLFKYAPVSTKIKIKPENNFRYICSEN